MNEVFNYITLEEYEKQKKILKDGETITIYEDTKKKIKISKRGRKVYKVIINYGDISIVDIARNLLIQA